jgi:arylformamidase
LSPEFTVDPDELLDREYNPRLRVPDCNDYFSRWKSDAAKARAHLGGELDVSYGDSIAEKLDFFPAAHSNGTSPPLLIFIHGGYWRALDKSDFSWVAPPYVDAGISVAIINYGLAPVIPIAEIVQQVRRACVWLHDNASQMNVDPNNLACSGHSAGGHLCGMMLATDWPSISANAPSNLFRCTIAISGLFDLQPLSRAPFLRNDIKLDEASARQLSPAYLRQFNDSYLLLAVGELESAEFHRQSQLLTGKWHGGRKVQQISISGCNHFSVCDAFATPGNQLHNETLKRILT